VIVYALDVEERNRQKDIETLAEFLKCARVAKKIYFLLHKMDKIEESKRMTTFESLKKEVSIACLNQDIIPIQVFPTSIWDTTLAKAWYEIIQNEIPERVKFRQIIRDLGA
jgi:Ras-related GTP-binding protein A/B